MESASLAAPFLTMLCLTIVVWIYMYIRRIGFMLKNKIPAHVGSTPENMRKVLPDNVNASANNLNNLFQIPLLFYAICLYLMWAGQADNLHLMCAWAFVILRAIHSLIHCTINHVMSRFVVYFVSSLVVFFMIIRAMLAL